MARKIKLQGKPEYHLSKVQASYRITLTKAIKEHLNVEVNDIVGFEILPDGRVEIFKVNVEKIPPKPSNQDK